MGNFISKDFWTEIPNWAGTSVEKVVDETSKRRVGKIIGMALARMLASRFYAYSTYVFILAVFQESSMPQKHFCEISINGVMILRVPLIVFTNAVVSLLFKTRPPISYIFP